MAQRRMISKHIYDSDKFLDLPHSTQNLYTHLIIRADDDGFVGNVKRILLMIQCSEIDLKLLISSGYVIPFETGVCVRADWQQFNKVQKSRHVPTMYLDERACLRMDANKRYIVPVNKH